MSWWRLQGDWGAQATHHTGTSQFKPAYPAGELEDNSKVKVDANATSTMLTYEVEKLPDKPGQGHGTKRVKLAVPRDLDEEDEDSDMET